MFMAIGRRSDRGAFKTVFYGGLCVLALAATAGHAAADNDPTAPAPGVTAPMSTPGVTMMAPIPDARSVATISPLPVASPPRQSILIKDGVVMMAPIPDGG